MSFDLKAALPTLLPKAVSWAEEQSHRILADGTPLTTAKQDAARQVGVRSPEKIRYLIVPGIPMPTDPMLALAASQTGLIGPHTAGMTLGYGIFFRRDAQISTRLLSHECRHVHQYEMFGSIRAFLEMYLDQIVTHGYHAAPLEHDARQHEIIS